MGANIVKSLYKILIYFLLESFDNQIAGIGFGFITDLIEDSLAVEIRFMNN